MMAFTMHCLRKKSYNARPSRWLQSIGFVLLIGLGCLSSWGALAQSTNVEISNIKAVRLDRDLAVSADIKFDLPSHVEEAMYKGVALTFVSEVEVTRERWYWLDKTVAQASRQTRISYQALTRRWRVLPWSEASLTSGLGVHLPPQMYDSLPEALAAARRIYNWRIIPDVELTAGNYILQLSYRLDISQLPKPLQIGFLLQGNWAINATVRQRFQLPEAGAP